MAITHNQTPSVIRIDSCSNSILWYNQHIGEEFEVSFYEEQSGAYWVRERGYPYALNWVYEYDATVIK